MHLAQDFAQSLATTSDQPSLRAGKGTAAALIASTFWTSSFCLQLPNRCQQFAVLPMLMRLRLTVRLTLHYQLTHQLLHCCKLVRYHLRPILH